MTIQRFKIKTVGRLETPPIEFRKVISLFPIEKKIDKGLNDSIIDLHQVEKSEGEFIPLRDYCDYFDLILIPEWSDNNIRESLLKIIFEDENLVETIIMNLYLLASDTKEIIDLQKINLKDIDISKEIHFNNINPKKYHGKIEVHSNLSRTKGHVSKDSFIADRKHFILAENRSFTIYLDEVKSIGSNYLDILPENLGRLLFRIRDWQEPGTDHPQFLYHTDIDKYIKGGDYYLCIQNFLMMGLIIYADHNLKWIIFSDNFSESNEYHLSIADYISKILNYKKADLLEINKLECEDKLLEYLKLSKLLLENIQDSSMNFKQIMKKFIENELEGN